MRSQSFAAWERFAWIAGILFVIVVVAAEGIAASLGVTVDNSPAKIVAALHDYRQRLFVEEWLAVSYAFLFLIYLGGLYNLLRPEGERPGPLAPLVLLGGGLGILMHAIPDMGIVGSDASKLTGSYLMQHDQGAVYVVYVVGYALAGAADVFVSIFALAAGLLVLGSGVLSRWLGWVAILSGILLLVQGFALGGVISPIGNVLDTVGVLFLLVFVLASSVTMLRRRETVPAARAVVPVPLK